MNTPTLQQLTQALRQAWSVDTGYAGKGVWTRENPARGQCVTSSLVVQDYFDGDIVRYEVLDNNSTETHYFNVLDDGTVIDMTRSQYKSAVRMTEKPIDLAKNSFRTVRERCMADEETRVLYLTLKAKIDSALAGSTDA